MAKTRKVNILYLTLLFFYAAVASVAFVFASMSQETIFNNGRIVGAMLALSSAPYLFIYALAQDFKSTRKSMYAAFGIIGIVGLYLIQPITAKVVDKLRTWKVPFYGVTIAVAAVFAVDVIIHVGASLLK